MAALLVLPSISWFLLGMVAAIILLLDVPMPAAFMTLQGQQWLAVIVSAWFFLRLIPFYPRLFPVFLLLSGGCTGIVALMLFFYNNPPVLLPKSVYNVPIQGQIIDVRLKKSGARVIMQLEKCHFKKMHKVKTCPQKVWLVWRKQAIAPKIGLTIAAKVNLYPLPLRQGQAGYGFGQYALWKGIGSTGRILSIQDVTSSEAFGIDSLRHMVKQHIWQSLEGQTAAVAQTLVLADRSALIEATHQSWRDSGIYHILSVSGLHMTLVTGSIILLLRYGLLLSMPLSTAALQKKITAILAIAGAGFYYILANAALPTMRAFIMCFLVLAGILANRRGTSSHFLCLAALIIIFIYPHSLFNVGFHLSFAAVAALVLMSEYFRRWHIYVWIGAQKWPYRWICNMGLLIVSSILISIFANPFMIYHFGKTSNWGMIANIMAIPLTSLWIMPCLLLAVLTLPIGVSHLFFTLAGFGIDGLNILALVMSDWPYVVTQWQDISVLWVALHAFIIFLTVNYRQTRIKGWLFLLLLMNNVFLLLSG